MQCRCSERRLRQAVHTQEPPQHTEKMLSPGMNEFVCWPASRMEPCGCRGDGEIKAYYIQEGHGQSRH